MARTFPLLTRFVIGLEIPGYGNRNTRQQQSIVSDLDRLLNDAAQAAGLDRRRWGVQPTGDGELAVLPPEVDLMRVVGPFVTELNRRLATRNEDHSPGTRIRLRVAMHIDAIMRNKLTYAGPALVQLRRLLGSAEVRETLEQADKAALALIISQAVHHKVIESGLGGLRPEQFREVHVVDRDEGYDEVAYIHVPCCGMHSFQLSSRKNGRDDASA